MIMNHIEVEKKWKAKWEESKAHAFDKQNTSKKYYMLEMFTYPSAANLHIGHAYNFAPADTFARFKKMQGYAVFQPMGFDSFGLPAENYAIKTGVHPKLSIASNIQKMRSQLQAFGATYDWDNEVITSDPSYYKWTQWLFIKFFEKGLVYQKQAPVNWCVGCNTAIANEQAAGGECERCKSQILKKNMRQWFFKITDYAQRLLDGLDTIDWPERTKAMQRHWIGKSEGAAIDFGVENSDKKICIFTTRADTLFGASYVVIAPEHDLVKSITTQKQKSAVEDYIEQSNKKSEVDRQCDKGEKTGVFCGAYCIHPISGERLEIWIADYCLGSYGTGAVMGVPAHDLRDFAFATKYGLKIKKVIECDDLPFAGDGVLVNSGQFDGLTSDEARIKIAEFLSGGGKGQLKTNYRLRDWSVSRQRYWGCPIPIVHCNKCGAVTVTEADLPVTLPDDVDFAPSGKSPLEKSKKFMDVACPKCGQDAKRDSDTLDTFVCSSWYF
ncbi:MAG: leucine--tRNA ligase, partial [Firmicutes bacterium]|nr:leucine--tRNA ligase [Bacillota bacterium]